MKTARQHNEDAFDFGALMEGIARSATPLVDAGAMATEMYYRPAIKALEQEFKESLSDPETKIKTSLQVAIATVIAMANASAANDYANAMVKRDQLARHEGRPDHDMTTHGTSLKAGS